MKLSRRLTAFVLLLFVMEPVLFAQDRAPDLPEFTAGGSIRLRGEFKDDFRMDPSLPGNDDEYLLSQFRANLRWTPTDWFSAFIEGQHAGMHGEDAADDDARPSIVADDLDLHQGYIDLDTGPAQLRAGRQKLQYGQQRLIGPLEWVNTARVFDAARARIGRADERFVDFFSSRVVAVDPDGWNDWSDSGNRHFDSDFHGIYSTYRFETGVSEWYYLFRHQSDFRDEVHTFGTRFEYVVTPVTLDGEFAYQFGDFGGHDHSAFAAHLGATYVISAESKTTAALFYNFASGDSDPSDSRHETFDNLYPTNHAFYGFMDLFAWQNLHNLELATATMVARKVTLRFAYHNFWLAEAEGDAWYNAGLGIVRPPAERPVSSYVGSEIDVTASLPLVSDWWTGEIGYSHFFTGDYVSDTGRSKDADFVYLQTKLVF